MKLDPTSTAGGDAGWSSVESAFAALGRVLIVLDEDFRVIRATHALDSWVCPGACTKIPGHAIQDLLGARLFGPDEPLRVALEAGEREEGRRAFVQCESGAARLASLSAAPLPPEDLAAWPPRARYLVILRPAEDDELILQGALAA